MASPTTIPARPLDGVRVLELGQLIAGPFAGCILAYFGAESSRSSRRERRSPAGGASSSMAPRCGGAAWAATKCITLNLYTEKAATSPGNWRIASIFSWKIFVLALEKWGLGRGAEADQPWTGLCPYLRVWPDRPYASRPGLPRCVKALVASGISMVPRCATGAPQSEPGRYAGRSARGAGYPAGLYSAP
jgi:hypothetical protein